MHFTVFCFLCHSGLEKLLNKGGKVSRDGRFEEMKKNVKSKPLVLLPAHGVCNKRSSFETLFKLATKQLMVINTV